MFCLYISSKLFHPWVEFSLKVKVMRSNPGYLLKSFLLYNIVTDFEDFRNDLKEQIQSKLNLYISKKFYRNIVKQVCKSYFCWMNERNKHYIFEFGIEPNSNLPLTFSHKISISTNHVWNFPFARKVLETFLIKSSRPHFRNSIWNSRKTGAKLKVS